MEQYEFHTVGISLYEFIWNDFCDNYIELVKNDTTENQLAVLLDVLETILKLLHPFMPYVTEEIYQMLPQFNAKELFPTEQELLDKILTDIVAIRNLKATNQISKEAKVIWKTDSSYEKIYASQLKIQEENGKQAPIDSSLKAIPYQSPYIQITYYVKEEVENQEQRKMEIEKLEASIARRKNLLANENYVKKAPSQIVQSDREKLQEEEQKLAVLKKMMENK